MVKFQPLSGEFSVWRVRSRVVAWGLPIKEKGDILNIAPGDRNHHNVPIWISFG